MLWFSVTFSSETFLSLRRTQTGINIYVYRSSCKVPVLLVRFQSNLNFLNIFKKKCQISWKFVQEEPNRFMREARHDEASGRFFAIWETRLQIIRNHFFLSYPGRRALPLSAPVTRITAARGQSLAWNTALSVRSWERTALRGCSVRCGCDIG